MTEFQDIDEFVKDIENPEFHITIDKIFSVTLDAQGMDEMIDDPNEELDREMTRQDVREHAAEFLNEEVEFEPQDILVTQESGREVEFE